MASSGDAKQVKTIEDLIPDAENANLGTEYGQSLLEDSLRKYGAGRSILVDKDGEVIAGNKTLEVAADLGLPIRVVQTDGRELVVVQRVDLDLTEGGSARELAYADNRVGEVNLDWDFTQIATDLDSGVDLSGLFADYDLEEMAAVLSNDFELPELDEGMVDEVARIECPECGHKWLP